jgi:hypothetical protein
MNLTNSLNLKKGQVTGLVFEQTHVRQTSNKLKSFRQKILESNIAASW